MDILLDSNVYLEDIKMNGNHFAELFIYLRRTGASLILPHLVQEEVLARYSEKLESTAQRAHITHDRMWKLAFSTAPDFNGPNVDKEHEALFRKLRNPAKGVRVVYVDEYAAIDVKEVVRRGVHRKRPANPKGEELRDVLLWLLALQFAKDYSGIAFISGDKGFAGVDGKSLHPDLLKEVTSFNVSLDFYQTARDFIVAKALDHEILTPEQFYSLVPQRKVEDLVVKLMIGASTRVGTVEAAEIREFEIQRVTSYKVGQNAFFVEAQCEGSANLSVQDFLRDFNSIFFTEAKPFDSSTVTYALNSPIKRQTSPFKWSVPVRGGIDPVLSIPFIQNWGPEAAAAAYVLEGPRRYLCSFAVGLSARTVAGHPESVEAEDFRFKSFLLDEQQPSTSAR